MKRLETWLWWIVGLPAAIGIVYLLNSGKIEGGLLLWVLAWGGRMPYLFLSGKFDESGEAGGSLNNREQVGHDAWGG